MTDNLIEIADIIWDEEKFSSAKIEKITMRDRIKDGISKFIKMYGFEKFILWDGEDAGEISRKLAALDPETCSRKDVDDIIGNFGWTALTCDVCWGQDKDVIIKITRNNNVFIGKPYFDKEHNIKICTDCMKNALDS